MPRPEVKAGEDPGLALPHRSDTPLLSEAEQLAFFDNAMSQCETATSHTGRVVRHIEVAGTRVELVFAGDRLIPSLFPALAHLELPVTGSADVSLHVWDTHSSGVDIPPPPVRRESFTDRGDIWGLSSRRIRSAFHWIEFSLNLLDLERRIGMFWVRSDEHVPYWTKASPLRTLMHWWTQANGAHLLHAAAFGEEDGALMITGKGGLGKSTTALACLTSGMRYVADDYLVVRLDPEPRVHSLYSTAKLDRPQMERFPQLARLVRNRQTAGDKAVVHLYPDLAHQICRSLPLKAIAQPSFSGVVETTFGPARALELQRAASFTTMSQLPHAGHETHEFIERMVMSVPGVSILLGTDLVRLPRAIGEFLERPVPAHAEPEAGVGTWPLVSVVIPVYNGASFIAGAVRAVFAQGYPAVEVIVVDDGSTDDVAAALRDVPADVRLFRQDNGGAASARNRGIRDASGDLIAFLDVDDLWPAENLSALVQHLLAHPDADVVRGRAQVTQFTTATEPGEYLGNPAESFPYYIGAGLYRRRAFERVGLFDADLRFGEDTDWYTRAAEKKLSIHRVDEVTLFVRRHDGNMTRGKSIVELNQLRLFKKMIDRRRNE
jgi:hypothetical protein